MERIEVGQAWRKSRIIKLYGRPYLVQLRNQGACQRQDFFSGQVALLGTRQAGMVASRSRVRHMLDHGVPGKGGDDIHVLLSEVALAVLRRQRGKHERFVFTYLEKSSSK